MAVERHAADLAASNETYRRTVAELQAEIASLNDLLTQIYKSKTWKAHLWLERLRGKG
jgi:hypothetical protein